MKIKAFLASCSQSKDVKLTDVCPTTSFEEFQKLISDQIFEGKEVDHFPIKNERLWLFWEKGNFRYDCNKDIVTIMAQFGFPRGGLQHLPAVLITGYMTQNRGPIYMDGTYCESISDDDLRLIHKSVF